MEKYLKKKPRIEDNTNNASISKQENSRIHSAILSSPFCLNTEILSNWMLETIPYS